MYGQNKFDNQIDNTTGEVKFFTPASDGTAVADAESIVLKPSDAGNYYFINIADNTCSVKLPSATKSKGAIFTFFMDITSDAEGTKDFILFTNAATEYLMGACFDGAGVHDQPSDDDFIQIDSSDGAVTVGDYLDIYCDGTDWYCIGTTVTAATIDIADTYNGHSLP